ncbi:Uncharacterised protein [Actinobacillus ureae]|uniref:hypothetical protein n=1 Tax=Actinobacillus ureae TaxID=723 RepID=UPI000E1821B1|nr:hypothetical protein [Actinobacillus ureae]SUT86638.1 Uncharacterised protein [Actinobacillus ureae]SUU46544.1 Uncharacterised protein [Actinobacillus ureae]
MAQKLLKHELVERLLNLKEKQDELTVQMQCLAQEISILTQPYMPKKQKRQPLITMRLVAQVLRENSDWMFCGEIAEEALALVDTLQFVDVGDKHYKTVNRILLKLRKRGIVENGFRFWRLKPLK